MQPYGDNFIPVIPVDWKEHTAEHPFCCDPTCSCHEDESNIDRVYQEYQDGEVTEQEATYIVQGKTV
ncbi:hypothetical protein ccbrp13_59770 [Ktedonobacteria bacterium brp13]|nr:hypothetical protein ccbrp13_59770 [Ktedonobacteria bacterium brp13]